ncbi:Gfo/Idh/MocA family protein [Nitrobacter winogradskyi]|uniref:Dehydrogenase n=1 Tax=Nitrobacter winogradskyi TaxID=913 RepID=A0ACC6AM85_NITWI|nr:Gfo/Idh/MocA family oxidoreductase [Nitrobacter winogradskyi]MCP1999985.1 putative dehydrogenase [Nitrobacter winogradskyi]
MFNWGVIGAGFAARKFVLGLRFSTRCGVKRVYSRNFDNTRTFARELAIPEAARNWGEALADGVDAVFIATPPSLHREHALRAFASGKHALIEKPLAASADDARLIVTAARDAGLFCMEGLWNLHLPIADRMQEVLKGGLVGEVRSFSGSFGTSNIPSHSDNQFNAALGGGALRHRLVYPLAWALALLGPARVVGAAGHIGSWNVDEDCVVILRHDSGVLSTLQASLRGPLRNDIEIAGDKGRLLVSPPIYRPFRFRVARATPVKRLNSHGRFSTLRESMLAQGAQQRLHGILSLINSARNRSVVSPYQGNGYHYQADEAARCVATGLVESPVSPLTRSLLAAELLDESARRFI